VEPKKIVGDTPISYTYVKGLSKNDKNASKIVILYETSSENHEGKGRHVLFLDGNVAWHSEESFQQLLTQQEAFLPPEQKPVEQEKKIPVPFLYPPEIRETRLTLGPFTDRYPVWSADGKRIAFIRSVGDRESLCIIDKTGCIQNNISLPFSKITFMNWAPGKEKILIISGGDIYTVDARNESVDKLTEAEGYEQAKWMQNEEIICLNDKEEYWKILQTGEKNFIQKKARKNLNTLITGDNLAVHSLSYRMHTHNLTTNSIEEWKQQVPSNSFSTNFSDFYSPDTNKFVFNAESPYRQLTSSIFIVGKDGGIWRYDIGVKTTLPTSVGLAPDKSGIVFAPWRDGETCISLLNFICSGKSEIRGFIPTEDFRRYKLEYGLGTKPTRWHLITDWKNEIPRNEVIAIWDTKTLKDGVYSLMITVETKTGHFSQDRITVQVANEKN
jgi:prepilin-type processing-associated H-X9-DG protein